MHEFTWICRMLWRLTLDCMNVFTLGSVTSHAASFHEHRKPTCGPMGMCVWWASIVSISQCLFWISWMSSFDIVCWWSAAIVVTCFTCLFWETYTYISAIDSFTCLWIDPNRYSYLHLHQCLVRNKVLEGNQMLGARVLPIPKRNQNLNQTQNQNRKRKLKEHLRRRCKRKMSIMACPK